MKKIFSIAVVLLAFTTVSVAQVDSQLKFTQVKLVTAEETVPAGKVWKVVSVVYNIPETDKGIGTNTGAGTTSPYYLRCHSINVDGQPTKVGRGTEFQASGSSNTYWHIASYSALPFWLPAGSTLDGGPCSSKVSVMEFSVVPE